MPQVINTNIASLTAQRNLNSSQGALSTALSRLSSGLRVNSAKDDAAGIAIATRLEAQSRGMSVAIRNSNDALSFLQTAEGGVSKITESLNRMRELAVQSANGTYTASDRANLNAEFAQLASEIGRVASQTEFNGLQMFNGSGSQTFQVGANSGEQVTITTTALSGSALTAATDATSAIISASTASAGAASASIAIKNIDDALDALSTERSTYGAAQSRFEGIVSILQISRENQDAAASRIMDAD